MAQSGKHLANAAPSDDADELPFDLPEAVPTLPKAAASSAEADDPPFDLPAAQPQPPRLPISARALQGSQPAQTAPAAYLDGLNPEQREAVETLDGPVLVLAGAGTGKTRVLTTRIAHILATGRARPAEILSVTFTNKAAREMKERVGKMVGQVVEGMPWLGTFHSFGGRILRMHAEMVQLNSNFTVLDSDDEVRLL
jgi:DNA helicase-2/ATP-dependent DNA helicase PcrA